MTQVTRTLTVQTPVTRQVTTPNAEGETVTSTVTERKTTTKTVTVDVPADDGNQTGDKAEFTFSKLCKTADEQHQDVLARVTQKTGGSSQVDAEASRAPEPATRVSMELPYTQELDNKDYNKRDQAESKRQSARADLAPGQMVARKSDGGKRGIRVLRQESEEEMSKPFVGIAKNASGYDVPEIRNPDSPSGKFDPFDFMPHMVFAPDEDSFPVPPDIDGDGDNNSDHEAYEHGVIGGNQPLEGAVSVSQKGEYTVVTYSHYYPDNKFTNYHDQDSSTMSVYLKPNAEGKLEPEYLYTSWHYGATMVPYDELAKDEQGRPVVLVERSSHALHPYGKDEEIPEDGLHVAGDGSTSLDGEALPHRMEVVSPQASFEGTRQLDLTTERDRHVMDSYFEKYPERMNPIHPVLFDEVYPWPQAKESGGFLGGVKDFLGGLLP